MIQQTITINGNNRGGTYWADTKKGEHIGGARKETTKNSADTLKQSNPGRSEWCNVPKSGPPANQVPRKENTSNCFRFEVLDELQEDCESVTMDVDAFKDPMKTIPNPFQASKSTGLVHEQAEPSGIKKGLKVGPRFLS